MFSDRQSPGNLNMCFSTGNSGNGWLLQPPFNPMHVDQTYVLVPSGLDVKQLWLLCTHVIGCVLHCSGCDAVRTPRHREDHACQGCSDRVWLYLFQCVICNACKQVQVGLGNHWEGLLSILFRSHHPAAILHMYLLLELKHTATHTWQA